MADVGVEEEFAGFGEGPVVWEGVFLLGIGFDVVDDFFESAEFADEFEGGVRADLWDWVDVVAAEEDAEVDELKVLLACMLCRKCKAHSYLLSFHTKPLENTV